MSFPPSDPLAPGSPDTQGFDAARLDRAMALLERGIADGVAPGAVALVARRGTIVACRAMGLAEREPRTRPMTQDTIFDLASVTKVVAGVSAALLLVDDGAWCLDDGVARFIPAFGQKGKGGVTLRHLLTHTSGLPAWRPCYAAARTPDEAYSYICSLGLDAPPGAQVQYSDLGLAMIRALVLRVAGEDLPDVLQRALFTPLGMHDTAYTPPAGQRDRIAATERGNGFERDMVARAGAHFDSWREHVLVGEVHDGNAHYALAGVGSHAGLFSSAADLARFAQLYLQQGLWEGRSVISPAAIAQAVRPQTAGLGTHYGLGWALPDAGVTPRLEPRRSALTRAIFPLDVHARPVPTLFGDLLSPQAYGHTGFTGTSLVIDPARGLILVLLTNAVHPAVGQRTDLARLRARWHNAVVAAMMA